MSRMMTARKADLILVLMAIIWGSGYTVTKVVVEVMSPIQFLTFRFVISAVLSLVIFRRRFAASDRSDWKAGILMGTFLTFAMLFQTVGLQYTGAGKAVFIASAFVIMVPFLFWAMTKEKPKAKILLACFIMLIGLGLLSIGPGGFSGWNLGDSLVLLSAVGFAFHTAVIGVFAPQKDPILLAGIQFSTAGALFLILGLFDVERQPFTMEVIWAILYSAVIITFVCFIIQVFCQKYTSPSHAAILINLETVFGSIIAVLFLGERYTPVMMGAFGIIFIAVLIAEVDWKEVLGGFYER